MKCTKCGSENIRVGVSVFMYISPIDVHRITKKALQKSTTELWSASWDKAQIICPDCGYIHIGC